jgi:hypothetical protein
MNKYLERDLRLMGILFIISLCISIFNGYYAAFFLFGSAVFSFLNRIIRGKNGS